jgi:hypothetical protein
MARIHSTPMPYNAAAWSAAYSIADRARLLCAISHIRIPGATHASGQMFKGEKAHHMSAPEKRAMPGLIHHPLWMAFAFTLLFAKR